MDRESSCFFWELCHLINWKSSSLVLEMKNHLFLHICACFKHHSYRIHTCCTICWWNTHPNNRLLYYSEMSSTTWANRYCACFCPHVVHNLPLMCTPLICMNYAQIANTQQTTFEFIWHVSLVTVVALPLHPRVSQYSITSHVKKHMWIYHTKLLDNTDLHLDT